MSSSFIWKWIQILAVPFLVCLVAMPFPSHLLFSMRIALESPSLWQLHRSKAKFKNFFVWSWTEQLWLKQVDENMQLIYLINLFKFSPLLFISPFCHIAISHKMHFECAYEVFRLYMHYVTFATKYWILFVRESITENGKDCIFLWNGRKSYESWQK